MNARTIPRTYVSVPRQVPPARVRLAGNALVALFATPFYYVLAGMSDTPGLGFRRRCAALGLRLLVSSRCSLRSALQLVLMPMDSTRYFEFDYVHNAIDRFPASNYLDVSSPRMVPVMHLLRHPDLRAELINPDAKDLEDTREIVRAAGLADRCSLRKKLIAEVSFEPEAFDLITCVSVLEHISEDGEAVRKMWSLLKSGGRLVITVPAMARANEQYVDFDEYGLLPADENGFVFWQRFYDTHLLQENVFSITGPPVHMSVYGERIAGSFMENAEKKRQLGVAYPFWKEPYMMARDYRFFDDIESLPGDGVIGLTFVKP